MKVLKANNCGLFEPSVTTFAEGTEKNQDKTVGSQNENRTVCFLCVSLDSISCRCSNLHEVLFLFLFYCEACTYFNMISCRVGVGGERGGMVS